MARKRGHPQKLYLAGLPQGVKKEDIKIFFGNYVNLIKKIVIKPGNSYGPYAFVHFEADETLINKIVDNLGTNGSIGDKNILLEFSSAPVMPHHDTGKSGRCFTCNQVGHQTKSCPKRIDLPKPSRKELHLREICMDLRNEITALKNEQMDLRNNLPSCLICLDNFPVYMFQPCMHVVICDLCVGRWLNCSRDDRCIKCREPILGVYRVHIG